MNDAVHHDLSQWIIVVGTQDSSHERLIMRAEQSNLQCILSHHIWICIVRSQDPEELNSKRLWDNLQAE